MCMALLAVEAGLAGGAVPGGQLLHGGRAAGAEPVPAAGGAASGVQYTARARGGRTRCSA